MESEEVKKFKRSTNSSSSESPGGSEGSDSLTTYMSEKRLKKDDSGITADGDTEDTELEDITLPVSTPPKAAKELNSPDSGNPESFQGIASPKADTSDDKLLSDSNLNSVPSESDTNCEQLESNSEQSEKIESAIDKTKSEFKDDTAPEAASEVDNIKKYDPTPSVPKPKCNWFVPKAILSRQYGTSLSYSPNSFRYDCYGSLQMVERLELMYKMKQHDGCVNALNFNSTGTKLVSGSDDLEIVIWDWAVSESILNYHSGHRSNVFQAKFLPLSNDRKIISCARDGQVRRAELSETGECKSNTKLVQHKGAAHKLAVQLDCPHTFISCGEDAAVFEMDVRDEAPAKLIVCKENGKNIPLYSIAINPSKPYEFCVSGRDQYVRVYDKRYMHQENMLKKFCPEHLVSGDSKANVTAALYNYNGEEILASYNDEDIYLFDVRSCVSNNFHFLHRYRGHRNSQTVKGVNFFGSKSEFILSGSDCGYIFFWEKQSEHIVKFMHGDEGGVVNCLEPNPHMPVLATSGLDDDIKIWVPSCENPPDLSKLREHISNNMKEREEEQSRNDTDTVDDQMMWFLMQHIRRLRRRTNQSSAAQENSSSSSSSDDDSNDDEFYSAIQCSQS